MDHGGRDRETSREPECCRTGSEPSVPLARVRCRGDRIEHLEPVEYVGHWTPSNSLTGRSVQLWAKHASSRAADAVSQSTRKRSTANARRQRSIYETRREAVDRGRIIWL